MARLTAERANLFFQMRGMDRDILSSPLLGDGCSGTDLLTCLGHRDAYITSQIVNLIEDRREAVLTPDEAYLHRLRRNGTEDQAHTRSVTDALAICLKERSGLIRSLQNVPDDRLFRRVYIRDGRRVSPYSWARGQFMYDAECSTELLQARAGLPAAALKVAPAPGGILVGLLRATRAEFLTIADLVPQLLRETRPLAGHWTLKNILSHITIFEQFGVSALTQLQAGELPSFSPTIANFDAFNDAQILQRHNHPWNRVLEGYQTTRRDLLSLLETTPEATLAVVFKSPWGAAITAYRLLVALAIHEQQHTDSVRQALGMARLPKRVRIFRD